MVEQDNIYNQINILMNMYTGIHKGTTTTSSSLFV